MYMAQKLQKPVLLSSYVDEVDVMWGYVQRDLCVAGISTEINCRSAQCWDPYDRECIQNAITKHSSIGFDGIDQAVEKIRLKYFLTYPLFKITGHILIDDNEEDKLLRKSNAIEDLSRVVETVLSRLVFSTRNDDEIVISFEAYKESNNAFDQYDKDPIAVFKSWIEHIEEHLE